MRNRFGADINLSAFFPKLYLDSFQSVARPCYPSVMATCICIWLKWQTTSIHSRMVLDLYTALKINWSQSSGKCFNHFSTFLKISRSIKILSRANLIIKTIWGLDCWSSHEKIWMLWHISVSACRCRREFLRFGTHPVLEVRTDRTRFSYSNAHLLVRVVFILDPHSPVYLCNIWQMTA